MSWLVLTYALTVGFVPTDITALVYKSEGVSLTHEAGDVARSWLGGGSTTLYVRLSGRSRL